MQPFGSPRRFSVAGAATALMGGSCIAVLALTNPSPEDYAEHAGKQLITVLTRELCQSEGVPMLLRLWVRDCPQLVESQQQALALSLIHI